MSDILEELIGRQFEIARGEAEALPFPDSTPIPSAIFAEA